jgi:surfeit locus 1 family protein
MKLRHLAAIVFVAVMTTVCIRLGFWQISRLHEKQALNAAQRAALAAPPVNLGDAAIPVAAVQSRRVAITGTFDERHQFLLAGHVLDGSPGVSVVTPLVQADGERAVLVERGWLPADDASTGHPERFPEPGVRTVTGMAVPLQSGRGGPALHAIRSDSASLWSARWVDGDSIGARVPYALAAFIVRELPGAGVPDLPRRTVPRPYDEDMHRNYAIQWFLFAVILLGGSVILAWKSRHPKLREVVPPMPRMPGSRD